MNEETAKALHTEMHDRARQATDYAKVYSVQFVQSDNPDDKARALRYMADAALWNEAAGLVHQARAKG